MFRNRSTAGHALAERIETGEPPDRVLAIPRGGLPVARPVADRLDVPLGVVVASKISAPGNPELALGAVAADGSAWFNDRLLDRVGIDATTLAEMRETEAIAAREKQARYTGGTGSIGPFDGEALVVVDDGLATGATAIACLRQLRTTNASRVVFAVPVGSRSAVSHIEREADAVVCLETPDRFGAVGRHYRSFGQVPDEEALSCLDR